MKSFKPGAARALFLSTTAFAVSFALWGLIGTLAPTLAGMYGLSAKAKSLMIAIPVLLGAMGRVPAEPLADSVDSFRRCCWGSLKMRWAPTRWALFC